MHASALRVDHREMARRQEDRCGKTSALACVPVETKEERRRILRRASSAYRSPEFEQNPQLKSHQTKSLGREQPQAVEWEYPRS